MITKMNIPPTIPPAIGATESDDVAESEKNPIIVVRNICTITL